MPEKLTTLEEAAHLIADGSTISIGGSLLQRTPAALVRELARQSRTSLHLVKPSPGYDGDLLSAAGVLGAVSAGMVSLEQPHGLAMGFRRAVERGAVDVVEHACITVASALRAASLGIPFQPVPGLDGSDIPEVSGFLKLTDPDTGEEIWAVRAIKPDWAILHVAEADSNGNARIYGTPNWDPLMASAAAGVILTADRIVETAELAAQPERTTIRELNVRAVVHAPSGAWPTSCPPFYGTDHEAVIEYRRAIETPEGLDRMLSDTLTRDRNEHEVGVFV
ncbi:MAG: CoA transferase subunit A [Nocardioidaceae bacterium]